jgi:hypothetical protein
MPPNKGHRFSIAPMMDWIELSIFQLVRRRRVHDVCTERSKKILLQQA